MSFYILTSEFFIENKINCFKVGITTLPKDELLKSYLRYCPLPKLLFFENVSNYAEVEEKILRVLKEKRCNNQEWIRDISLEELQTLFSKFAEKQKDGTLEDPDKEIIARAVLNTGNMKEYKSVLKRNGIFIKNLICEQNFREKILKVFTPDPNEVHNQTSWYYSYLVQIKRMKFSPLSLEDKLYNIRKDELDRFLWHLWRVKSGKTKGETIESILKCAKDEKLLNQDYLKYCSEEFRTELKTFLLL